MLHPRRGAITDRLTSALALAAFVDAYNGVILLLAGKQHFGAGFSPVRHSLDWLYPGDAVRWLGATLLALAVISWLLRLICGQLLRSVLWLQTIVWVAVAILFWSNIRDPTGAVLLPGFASVAAALHLRAALFWRPACRSRPRQPVGH